MNYFRNAMSKLYDAVSASVAERVLNILVRNFLQILQYIPEQFKTLEMCEQAVKEYAELFRFVPDEFITQEICDQVVKEDA